MRLQAVRRFVFYGFVAMCYQSDSGTIRLVAQPFGYSTFIFGSPEKKRLNQVALDIAWFWAKKKARSF